MSASTGSKMIDVEMFKAFDEDDDDSSQLAFQESNKYPTDVQ